jgi:hypothetical protein
LIRFITVLFSFVVYFQIEMLEKSAGNVSEDYMTVVKFNKKWCPGKLCIYIVENGGNPFLKR